MSGNKIGLVLALCMLLLGLAEIVRWYGGVSYAQAVRIGHLAAVQSIIKDGASVNTTGSDGVTPLMVAADAGDLKCVRQFLTQGARVNAADAHNKSALYWAAASGRSIVVRELLAHGAALQAQEPFDDSWNSPRAAAETAGHREIAAQLAKCERLSCRLLVETQAEWTASRARSADAETLSRWRRWLEQGACANWYDLNGDSLFAVVTAGDLPAVQLLLEFHADPNFRTRMDGDVAAVAAQHPRPAVLQELLRHGASVEGQDPFMRPLGCAVAERRLENARILLEHGANPTQQFLSEPLLAICRKNGDTAMAELLRAHGSRQ